MTTEMEGLAREDEPPVSVQDVLEDLRKIKPASLASTMIDQPQTTGERMADAVAEIVGSWKFIIIQSVLLAIWMVLNLISWIEHWDPYPFILLNLVLSFQAAFTAPIIMMSQNRQNSIDRKRMESDFNINIKAEMEIEQLHLKLDLLREQEIKALTDVLRKMESQLCKA